MIRVNINLDQVPQGAIWTNQKGEKMVSIVVASRKEVDQYGNTHSVYINQSEEERLKGTPKIYVGRGKEYSYNQNK